MNLFNNFFHFYLKFKIVVDAVLAINEENKPIDLFMVEIMEMMHKTESDTK
jgi:T-complex protein 1 subunit zeta